jgi:hypothetical protein
MGTEICCFISLRQVGYRGRGRGQLCNHSAARPAIILLKFLARVASRLRGRDHYLHTYRQNMIAKSGEQIRAWSWEREEGRFKVCDLRVSMSVDPSNALSSTSCSSRTESSLFSYQATDQQLRYSHSADQSVHIKDYRVSWYSPAAQFCTSLPQYTA